MPRTLVDFLTSTFSANPSSHVGASSNRTHSSSKETRSPLPFDSIPNISSGTTIGTLSNTNSSNSSITNSSLSTSSSDFTPGINKPVLGSGFSSTTSKLGNPATSSLININNAYLANSNGILSGSNSNNSVNSINTNSKIGEITTDLGINTVIQPPQVVARSASSMLSVAQSPSSSASYASYTTSTSSPLGASPIMASAAEPAGPFSGSLSPHSGSGSGTYCLTDPPPPLSPQPRSRNSVPSSPLGSRTNNNHSSSFNNIISIVNTHNTSNNNSSMSSNSTITSANSNSAVTGTGGLGSPSVLRNHGNRNMASGVESGERAAVMGTPNVGYEIRSGGTRRHGSIMSPGGTGSISSPRSGPPSPLSYQGSNLASPRPPYQHLQMPLPPPINQAPSVHSIQSAPSNLERLYAAARICRLPQCNKPTIPLPEDSFYGASSTKETVPLFLCPDLPPQMARHRWCLHDYIAGKKLYTGYASTVYKGTCRKSEMQVVLKIYHLSCVCDLYKFQIYREVRIHSSLRHPNVVRLLAAFQEDDKVVLVQELIDGMDLLALLSKRGLRLPEQEAVRLVLDPFLRVIEYLHSQMIMHRDLKPENVLLTADSRLKLGDFGLAINLREERSVTRAGTLDYMAPEVIRCPFKDRPDDHKEDSRLHYGTSSDIWSIGVMAFELIAGFPPFIDYNRNETVKKIQAVKVPYMSFFSMEAKSFIAMALNQDPSKRPTIRDMIEHPFIASNRYLPHLTIMPGSDRGGERGDKNDRGGGGGGGGQGHNNANGSHSHSHHHHHHHHHQHNVPSSPKNGRGGGGNYAKGNGMVMMMGHGNATTMTTAVNSTMNAAASHNYGNIQAGSHNEGVPEANNVVGSLSKGERLVGTNGGVVIGGGMTNNNGNGDGDGNGVSNSNLMAMMTAGTNIGSNNTRTL